MTDTSLEIDKLQLIFENLQNDCEGTEEKVIAAIAKIADVPLPAEIKCKELEGFVIRSARSRFDLLSDALAIRMAGGNVIIKERDQESGSTGNVPFKDFSSPSGADTALKKRTSSESFLSRRQISSEQSDQGFNLEGNTENLSEEKSADPGPSEIKKEFSLFDKWQNKEKSDSVTSEPEKIQTHSRPNEQWKENEKDIISDHSNFNENSSEKDVTEVEPVEIRKFDWEGESESGDLFRWEVPVGSDEPRQTPKRQGPDGSTYDWKTVEKENSKQFSEAHNFRHKNRSANKLKKRKITINDPEMARLLDEYDRLREDFSDRSGFIQKGCFRFIISAGVILGVLIYRAITDLPH